MLERATSVDGGAHKNPGKKLVESEKSPSVPRKSKEPARAEGTPPKIYWVHRLTFHDELNWRFDGDMT